MSEENMTDLTDVLHVLVDRVRWFTEAAKDNAHSIVEQARTKQVAAKKTTAKPPRTVPPTDVA
jgi:hypothetical protein